MQHKNYLVNLMEMVYSKSIKDISCSYIAEITKLDKSKALATVQPLAMIDNKKQSEIEQVPFLTIPYQYQYIDTVGSAEIPKKKKTVKRKLDYKKGDTVLCVVMDDDDMYFKNKGKFKVTSDRKHAVDFSIIIGKIATKNDFKFPK